MMKKIKKFEIIKISAMIYTVNQPQAEVVQMFTEIKELFVRLFSSKQVIPDESKIHQQEPDPYSADAVSEIFDSMKYASTMPSVFNTDPVSWYVCPHGYCYPPIGSIIRANGEFYLVVTYTYRDHSLVATTNLRWFSLHRPCRQTYFGYTLLGQMYFGRIWEEGKKLLLFRAEDPQTFELVDWDRTIWVGQLSFPV